MKGGPSQKTKRIFIGISLSVVAVCLIAAAPWLLVVVPLLALGFWSGFMKDKASQSSPSRAQSAPLSATVNNDIRIMTESLELVNHSVNLQTVIDRYDVLIAALGRLSAYENNPAVSFPHELPSVALERIKSEKPQIMNRAIQRAHDDVLHKCAALKTEKGRKNRHMKFFDELNALMDRLPLESREFAVDFINQNINDPLTGLEGL